MLQPEKNIIDEIIEGAKIAYGKMSLLQLLAEENMLTQIMHSRGADPARKKLLKVLRSEIEGRLR